MINRYRLRSLKNCHSNQTGECFIFLLLKRTLRNKQCLLHAKLGCARLQLQASSHCTRWHVLCDDGSFSSLKECRACEVYSTAIAFEDGGVQNISRIKIYRTPIILSPFALQMLMDRDFSVSILGLCGVTDYVQRHKLNIIYRQSSMI